MRLIHHNYLSLFLRLPISDILSVFHDKRAPHGYSRQASAKCAFCSILYAKHITFRVDMKELNKIYFPLVLALPLPLEL